METFTKQYHEAEPTFTTINNHAYIESVGFENAGFIINLKPGIHDRDLKESVLTNRGIEDLVAEYGSEQDKKDLAFWIQPEHKHRLFICFSCDDEVTFS